MQLQDVPQEIGRRAALKARRRDSIERTALRLFVEQGYDETTVSHIAAAEDISLRTVAYYFPGKVDFVLAQNHAAAGRLVESLEARPLGEGLIDFLRRWLEVEAQHRDLEMHALRSAIFASTPQLKALRGAPTGAALEAGARCIADETGLPLSHPAVSMGVAAIAGVLDVYAGLPDPTTSEAREALILGLSFLDAGLRALGTGTGMSSARRLRTGQ